ncbi:MAG: hypothetical protein ACJAQ6_002330 [Arenicella sp.]|jgi:hypothetical protein
MQPPFIETVKFNRANGIEAHQRVRRLVKKGHTIDVACRRRGRVLELFVEQGFNAKGLDFS